MQPTMLCGFLAACLLVLAHSVNLRHSALTAHEVHAASTMTPMSALEVSMNASNPEVSWLQMSPVIQARIANSKMTYQEAIDRLADKMPRDVAVLVKVTKKSLTRGAAPTFSEDSLQKARKILNEMIEASQAEMDDVIIDCEEFKVANRKTFDQVVTDLARLGSEIAKAEEQIAENMHCVTAQDSEFKVVFDLLKRQESSYLKTRAANERELTLKKNDLAVFNFIMDLTKCQDNPPALVQVGQHQQVGGNETMPLYVCSTKSGFELNFKNPKLQADFDAISTPASRLAIREALGLAFAGKLGGGPDAGAPDTDDAQEDEPVDNGDADGAFLQEKKKQKADPPKTNTTAKTTTTPMPAVTQKPTPVKKEPAKAGQWKKCTDGKPDCGLLHDTMSLQWGKFKDLVDQLEDEMDQAKDRWSMLKANLNAQLKVITHQKGECQSAFDATVGEKNTKSNERGQKDQQHRELSATYEAKMAACKGRIEEILFTDICAVRTVRNVLLTNSTVSPPLKISDCEVGEWVASVCSVGCDNSCPHMIGKHEDPYSCGGWANLNRQIIVNANEFGLKCPALHRRSRCGQFKCSVNCHVSAWSGWSKCTKECEGGAQQQTRSIMTKPKHGGQECPSTIETRACNTGSCDRDCSLDGWSSWTPCSMACNPGHNPGWQERHRDVLVPIRGQGKCPQRSSFVRYEKQTCNEHPCKGDEICIARLDLIIAIDASGSVKADGYQVVRDFAGNLTKRFQSQYLGMEAVHLGVILFGNGARKDDGTIAEAMVVSALTDDFDAVATKIQATTWQRGFTNMAQAFMMADTMFQQGGRANAQSAILVISDGKYSFAFQTEKAVNVLKAKNTAILMAPIASRPGKFEPKLKEWASQPWETNYELIPGIAALADNMGIYSSALVAKFCSHAISPSRTLRSETQSGLMIVREGGRPNNKCSMEPIDLGYVRSVAHCRQRAERDAQAYSFSIGWERGKPERHCYAEGFKFSAAEWEMWLNDKKNIPCPGGDWKPNPSFDTYAIQIL